MNSIPPSFKPNGSMYVYFRSEDKWIASYRNERITHVCSLKNGTVPKDTRGLVRICIDLWTKIIRHICIIWLINRLKCVIQVSIYKFEAVWYENGLRCLILHFFIMRLARGYEITALFCFISKDYILCPMSSGFNIVLRLVKL